MKNGQEVADNDMLQLLNEAFALPAPRIKGFILDLPYEVNAFWLDCLKNNKIHIPRYLNRQFTHVIELRNSDTAVQHNQEGIFESPENFKVFSAYDREMLKRPKKKVEGEEEEEEDEENQQKAVEVDDLCKRPSECHPISQDSYQAISQFIEYAIPHIQEQEYIRLDRSLGQSPEQLVDACLVRLNLPLLPQPVQLEAGSDDNLKDLLTSGQEENEVPRMWSCYQQVDVVALEDQKLLIGKGEFACAYAGRVFLFFSEENQKKFMENPKNYLRVRNKMPARYNISL